MTLRELSRLAQLSPAAVSLALRDSPKISVATKKRIRRLAQQVGYRADARLVEMMRHLRKPAAARQTACFGVISFYESPRPWEGSAHLTRMFEGMTARANDLGYRLEPLWLRAPGMSYSRFKGIIETRGIEGLLCFGSPDIDQEFPAELNLCATVTQGQSIRTPMHRVVSHAFNDITSALRRLHELGYRRPGLVLGRYEESRSGYAQAAAYLGWCERELGGPPRMPILRLEQVETEPLLEWYHSHRPDAVVFVHGQESLKELRAVLRDHAIRTPEDLGVLAISPVVERSGFAGLQENQRLMGAWAVELLAARVANRDWGIPQNPRVEFVESHWIAGNSLRRPRGQR